MNNITVNELFKELSAIPEELEDSNIQISTDYRDLEKVEGVGIITDISLKEIKLSFY